MNALLRKLLSALHSPPIPEYAVKRDPGERWCASTPERARDLEALRRLYGDR